MGYHVWHKDLHFFVEALVVRKVSQHTWKGYVVSPTRKGFPDGNFKYFYASKPSKELKRLKSYNYSSNRGIPYPSDSPYALGFKCDVWVWDDSDTCKFWRKGRLKTDAKKSDEKLKVYVNLHDSDNPEKNWKKMPLRVFERYKVIKRVPGSKFRPGPCPWKLDWDVCQGFA